MKYIEEKDLIPNEWYVMITYDLEVLCAEYDPNLAQQYGDEVVFENLGNYFGWDVVRYVLETKREFFARFGKEWI